MNQKGFANIALAIVAFAVVIVAGYFAFGQKFSLQQQANVLGSVNSIGVVSPVGSVVMTHDDSGTWSVYLPQGGKLDISGTKSQGLQEAINYAQKNGYPFNAQCGDTTHSTILVSSTIVFPVGRGNSYNFYGCTLLYNGPTGNDFITIDSSDFTEIDFHDSEIVYPGTKAAVHFLPVHDNGESFAGFTSNTFRFGSIVPATASLDPDPTRGIGLQISTPGLTTACGGGHCVNGNGIFTNNNVYINEINGGLVGIQVDNPGVGNSVSGNHFTSPAIHMQNNFSLLIGLSLGASNRIFGNQSKLTLTPNTPGTALSTWGGADFGTSNIDGDIFDLVILNGTNGIVAQSSSRGNLFRASAISVGGSKYQDNGRSNKLDVPFSTRTVVTCSQSPCIVPNVTGRSMSVFVSGNDITSVGMSIDGTNFDTDATNPFPQNSRFTLLSGMTMKIIYAGAKPWVITYY